MKRSSARKLDVSAAGLCGSFVGTASGLAVLGAESRPPLSVLLALFVAAVAASTVAALIANAYARHRWPDDV